MAIEQELKEFDDSLTLLASHTGISPKLLNHPESVLVEASNRTQFIKLQEAFALYSLFMAVRQEGWRFKAVVQRRGAYTLPHFGEIEWVEIAEPSLAKPEQANQPPRVRSISFYVDDIGTAETVLKARKLHPEPLEDGISIRLRDTGHKVVFTDVGVSYSIMEDVRNEQAVQVQLDPSQ